MISLVRGKLGTVRCSSRSSLNPSPTHRKRVRAQGGKPDLTSAALTVIHDWNIGKIPFFTVPPAIHPSMISKKEPVAEGDDGMQQDDEDQSGAAYASTSIVSAWSKPFDLEGLWDVADAEVLDEIHVEEEGEEGDGGFVPDEDEIVPE